MAVVCAPASGSTFPLGPPPTVTSTATDDAGNFSTASFTVTVVDTAAPELMLSANLTVTTTGVGAAVSYTVTATDLVDTSVAQVCEPISGSTFPLGMTTVNCTATDDAGNVIKGSFTVTVQDNAPPDLTVPANITVPAVGAGAVVSFAATATDNVAGVTVGCVPPSGSTFPVGTTTVDCTATDAAGLTDTGSFTVTVEDQTPPMLTLPANLTAPAIGTGAVVPYTVTVTDAVDASVDLVCAPASGKAVSYAATATDDVSGSVPVVCVPASGSTFAIGTTTVNCSATDGAGNIETGTFRISVKKK